MHIYIYIYTSIHDIHNIHTIHNTHNIHNIHDIHDIKRYSLDIYILNINTNADIHVYKYTDNALIQFTEFTSSWRRPALRHGFWSASSRDFLPRACCINIYV